MNQFNPRGHLRQAYCQHGLHRQTLLLAVSHTAPPLIGSFLPHLYALLTALQKSQLRIYSQDICSRFVFRAFDTLSRVTNSLLTGYYKYFLF